MTVFVTPFFCFTLCLVAMCVFCPYTRQLALRLGAIDRPDTVRKCHRDPTPRLGGLALYASLLVSFFVSNTITLPLFLGLTLLTLGLAFDDLQGLSAGQKLSLQLMSSLPTAVSLMKEGGGSADALFALFFLVMLCNAFNLMDGLDGLCSGSGAILALTAACLSQGNTTLLLSLGGACLGFLPFNFASKKQFLGDCGSQAIGFMLGYALLTSPPASPLAPSLLLLYPIFEVVSTVVRRLLIKKSPLSADRGHFHHCLLDLGYSPRKAVVCLLLWQSFFAVAALSIGHSFGGVITLVALALLLFLLMTHSTPKKETQPTK